jgi:hypothetical protein
MLLLVYCERNLLLLLLLPKARTTYLPQDRIMLSVVPTVACPMFVVEQHFLYFCD